MKSYILSSLLFIVLFFIVSCGKNPEDMQFSIGSDIIKSDARISICDTLSLTFSTVQIDSMRTSGTDTLIAGEYIDDRTGKISSQSYFQLSLPESKDVQQDDVFDSLTCIVSLNGYYYGDTTAIQEISLQRLTEDIELTESGYLYNTSNFSSEVQPLGKKEFKPYPLQHKEIEVPMDKLFGQNLFNLFLNGDDKVSTIENFQDWFKGLHLKVNSKSKGAILGFSASDSLLVMRMYTHRISEEKQEIEYDFKMNNKTTCFNQIIYNRSNTKFEGLKDQRNDLVSTETANESIIQGGVGLMTRIEIPGLGKLLDLEKASVLKAELILRPVLNTYSLKTIPYSLSLTEVDRINRAIGTYTDPMTKQSISGTLITGGDIYEEDIYYSVDITQYVNNELKDNYYESGNTGLMLGYLSPDIRSSINRIVLGNSSHKNQKSQVKIYLLKYDD